MCAVVLDYGFKGETLEETGICPRSDVNAISLLHGVHAASRQYDVTPTRAARKYLSLDTDCGSLPSRESTCNDWGIPYHVTGFPVICQQAMIS